jgi:hypothetical protein
MERFVKEYGESGEGDESTNGAEERKKEGLR